MLHFSSASLSSSSAAPHSASKEPENHEKTQPRDMNKHNSQHTRSNSSTQSKEPNSAKTLITDQNPKGHFASQTGQSRSACTFWGAPSAPKRNNSNGKRRQQSTLKDTPTCKLFTPHMSLTIHLPYARKPKRPCRVIYTPSPPVKDSTIRTILF